MLPFETGDFYIEIFLFAISPSSLREGPEGLMSIFPLCIMGPLSRPRSKILRVAVSRIILSSEASKVKLVGNLVA